ncbi:MAG: DNA photolyase, partial [Candidatus Delongbacteria bacterium]|nr:DNA photolyase [Candidatus Delongbacteria bacterium]
LRFYLNNPDTFIYVNTDDLFRELAHIHTRLGPGRMIRVGTGEFTDSLALDAYTGFSDQVIEHVESMPQIIFELKTKSDQIGLLSRHPRVLPNLVIGWSLNPESVVHQQEPGTADLRQRLEAARILMRRGYKLALHFDPIFHYPDWEHDYQHLISLVFQYLDPRRIAWISLGIFRFQPDLRQKIFQQTPDNPIIYDEFIQGIDGKQRLHISIRYQIYRNMIQWLHRIDPRLFIYLCMESHYLWRELFEHAPQSMAEVESGFIRRYRSMDENPAF